MESEYTKDILGSIVVLFGFVVLFDPTPKKILIFMGVATFTKFFL